MQIQSISFKGEIALTKNGNPYNKKSGWKKFGTLAGLVGTSAFAFTKTGKQAIEQGTKLLPKNFKGANIVVIALGVVLGTILGREIIGLPNTIGNNNRKQAADEKITMQIQKTIKNMTRAKA